MITERRLGAWAGMSLGVVLMLGLAGCSTQYCANRGRDLVDIFEMNGGWCIYGQGMRTPYLLASAQVTRGGHFAIGSALVSRAGLYGGRFASCTESGSGLPMAPFRYFPEQQKKPSDPGYTFWRYEAFDRWDYFLGLPSYYRDLWETRRVDVELGMMLDSPTHWFDVSMELAFLFPDMRVGLSPGEFGDFIAGLVGFDPAGDDRLSVAEQEGALQTALARAKKGGRHAKRYAILLAYRYPSKPGAAAIFGAAAEFEDPDLRGLALFLMRGSEMPPRNRLPVLLRFLKDANVSLRQGAVAELGRMGNKAAVAIPVLIDMMESADHYVMRILATDSLGNVAASARKLYRDMALKALAKHLQDPDEIMRLSAFSAVDAFGAGASPVIPQLIQAIKNPRWEYRRNAVHLLGRMGKAAQSAVPFLETLDKDPDVHVQRNAQKALNKIKHDIEGR